MCVSPLFINGGLAWSEALQGSIKSVSQLHELLFFCIKEGRAAFACYRDAFPGDSSSVAHI